MKRRPLCRERKVKNNTGLPFMRGAPTVRRRKWDNPSLPLKDWGKNEASARSDMCPSITSATKKKTAQRDFIYMSAVDAVRGADVPRRL